jgi:PAS domain S-box-containing protein
VPDEQVAERIKTLSNRAPQDVEVELLGGRKVLARYRPVSNGCLLLTYEDITGIRRIEVTLKEEEERYKLVTRAVSEGVYDWTVGTDLLHVSDRLKSLFDFAQIDVRSSEWFDRLHPDDAAGYRTALRTLFKGEHGRLQHEYRIRIRSGEYRWVRDQAIACAARRTRRSVGAVSDITDEKTRSGAAAGPRSRRRRADHVRGCDRNHFGRLCAFDPTIVSSFATPAKEFFRELRDMARPGTSLDALLRAAVARGMFRCRARRCRCLARADPRASARPERFSLSALEQWAVVADQRPPHEGGSSCRSTPTSPHS